MTLPKLNNFLNTVKFDPSIDDTRFRIAVTDSTASLLVPILTRDVPPRQRIFCWIPLPGKINASILLPVAASISL